jgi:hypothetical protein
MYWAVRDDGTFEIIDGQQRTISVCQYVSGDFSFDNLYIHNLPSDKHKQFLDYKLTVYLCSGTDSERLDWFRTINIVGAKLTNQELRNAVYSGSWVTDAKRHFSRAGGPAASVGGDYLSGSPIRQEYLETVIDWINNGDIEAYMAEHQHDPNANTEWLYFQAVIAWVQATFPTLRKKAMRSVAWGTLYNNHKDVPLDAAKLEKEVARLMADEDVTNKKGIYTYVLNGKERHLNIRAFTDNQKIEAYERQAGICPKCKQHFELADMEADHIVEWAQDGPTSAENCQMLCKPDHQLKTNA